MSDVRWQASGASVRPKLGWRAMAFATSDINGKPHQRPVAQSRIFACKDAAQAYADALRAAGKDDPYIAVVERIERKVPDIA